MQQSIKAVGTLVSWTETVELSSSYTDLLNADLRPISLRSMYAVLFSIPVGSFKSLKMVQ